MLMFVRGYKINQDHITIELPCITIIVNRTDIKPTGSTEDMTMEYFNAIIRAVIDSYSQKNIFDFDVLGRGFNVKQEM